MMLSEDDYVLVYMGRHSPDSDPVYNLGQVVIPNMYGAIIKLNGNLRGINKDRLTKITKEEAIKWKLQN